MNTDIRWIQRFQNYQKAFAQLAQAADLLEAATALQPGTARARFKPLKTRTSWRGTP